MEPSQPNNLDIKIKLLHPDAKVPAYAKEGDAGMDIYATEITKQTKKKITYSTGIAIEIPFGYVGLIFPRSSIRDKDMTLTNCVGVIDSGYRGEIQFTFRIAKKKNPNLYAVGDRIGQLIVLPYPQINFTITDELTTTKRGTEGFGSTGK
jgi:dUTP pyrophosphatase